MSRSARTGPRACRGRISRALVVMAACGLAGCAGVESPDVEFNEELGAAYQACFDVVERDTGRDLSPEELSGDDALPELRLARNRIIAAVNEAAEMFRTSGTADPIRLPVLFVREPGDPGYAEDALYDMECVPDPEDLVQSPGAAPR